MCYSAQIWASWRKFERVWHTGMSIQEFAELYIAGMSDKRIRISKAMDLGFADPLTEAERGVKALIDERNAKQAAEWEQELFKQRKRLATIRRHPTFCRPSLERLST